MSVFGWCLRLDNTPSTVSIIPDDADDAMHAGDAKQGAENCRKRRGNARETGVTGSGERNGGERNCTNMKKALERNQNAGKCKGRTRREPEDGNEKKLLEIMLEIMGNEEKLKRNEGMCRKLT